MRHRPRHVVIAEPFFYDGGNPLDDGPVDAGLTGTIYVWREGWPSQFVYLDATQRGVWAPTDLLVDVPSATNLGDHQPATPANPPKTSPEPQQ